MEEMEYPDRPGTRHGATDRKETAWRWKSRLHYGLGLVSPSGFGPMDDAPRHRWGMSYRVPFQHHQPFEVPTTQSLIRDCTTGITETAL